MNKPTESAVRAAEAVSGDAMQLLSLEGIVKIIDAECHLPELKEVLEKVKEALKGEHRFHCSLWDFTLVAPQRICDCGYDGEKRAALAAIEGVKI